MINYKSSLQIVYSVLVNSSKKIERNFRKYRFSTGTIAISTSHRMYLSDFDTNYNNYFYTVVCSEPTANLVLIELVKLVSEAIER